MQMTADQESAAKATEDDTMSGRRRVDDDDDHDVVFDAGKPPPFRIGDVRAAVPEHCWRKSPWRSLWYVARDVAVVAALGAAAAGMDSWAVWPLYWAAQGTMFWALFVLGHDWYVRRSLFLLLFCFLFFRLRIQRRRNDDDDHVA
jgi:uncharacterized membrane protein